MNRMSISDTQHLGSGDLLAASWPGASAPDSADDLLGATLNNSYVVERLLGEGGMGRVYLARHTRIEKKRVAVKVLHAEFSGSAHIQARFQREAETAAAISHPNVVTVLDIDVTPRGMPYLVCEYLEGVDLADHLKQVGRLDVATAVDLTRQLCRGLGAAHARGIIHRDLKPPNIFLVGGVDRSGAEPLYAKVVDFGLSRFDATSGDENNLTKTGLIMGTPSYMSPEQAEGKRVDYRVDIYGVGAILYKAVTGRAPFNEESPQATMLAVMNSEPPRPRSLVPNIPPHLELIIERAMAKDPAQRYQDMAAFEQALDALAPAGAGSSQAAALERPRTSVARRPHPGQSSEGDVQAARPRLLLVSLSAVLLAICAATTAISGVELASGYTFDRVELRLLLLAIVGSSLTPATLWILRVRRRIWDNSSRVLLLLGQLRAAVLAGIVSYGLFQLAFNVQDSFLVRLLDSPGVKPVGASWVGWNLLLPAAALSFALGIGWRRQLLTTWRRGWRQSLAVWLITGLSLAVVIGLIYGGVLWRASLSAG